MPDAKPSSDAAPEPSPAPKPKQKGHPRDREDATRDPGPRSKRRAVQAGPELEVYLCHGHEVPRGGQRGLVVVAATKERATALVEEYQAARELSHLEAAVDRVDTRSESVTRCG